MKLRRFIRKEKLQGPATSAGYEYLSRLKSVFNDRQESDLAEHIKALCNQYYGFSVVKCRCLAYEFATKNNVNMPDNWARDGKAGVEWMMSFKRRHGLAIRQPEATSLARATAFNRYVVDQFYDNLATVMDKYKFASKDIFNVDESGCHTVQTRVKLLLPAAKNRLAPLHRVSVENWSHWCTRSVRLVIPSLPCLYSHVSTIAITSSMQPHPVLWEQQTSLAGSMWRSFRTT